MNRFFQIDRCAAWLFKAGLIAGSLASNSALAQSAAGASAAVSSTPTTKTVILDKPPIAKTDPVADTFFGTAVIDNYRYMEKLDDPYVAAWFKDENDYCRQQLARLPGRKALLDRITALDASRTIHVGLPEISGGSYFYKKRGLADLIAKIYMRPGLAAAEKLMIDPDSKPHPAGKHNAVDFFTPSQDGKLLAYGISLGGSEDSVIHVVSASDGKDTSDTIDRARFAGVSWLPDGKSFFYNRVQKLAKGAPVTDTYRDSRVYIHLLGDDPEKDRPVFGAGLSAKADMSHEDIPFCILVPDSQLVFGLIEHGVQNEQTVYIAPLADLIAAKDAASIPWVKVCDIADQVTSFDIHGNDIYMLSHKGASRFKVLKTNANKPDMAAASVVMPASDAVITTIAAAKDALYVTLRDGGVDRLKRVSYVDGKADEISLPVGGSVEFAYDARAAGGLVALTGWTRAYSIFSFDSAKNTLAETDLQPKGPFDAPGDLVSEEVKAKSADGTMIPLSIVYKKGLKKDGSNPTWLDGYGSYGMSIDPGYGAIDLAWIEQGGVLAYAHVRGGGEYGEDWHLAGKMATKPNTWKDFIACGEYLIENKYTSSAKLCGSGTSAGGILIGRTITTRPDLFGAACIDVGVSNPLRAEFGANGVPNIPEFGTVKDEQGFKALVEMDSVGHVKQGEKYPAVLLTTGINDPRVDSWEPAKMTASLQAATASGKPVMLRVDYDAGHGFGSTKQQRFELMADEEAFFLWQAGVPAFQPAP